MSIKGQIGLATLALRAGLNPGVFEGPPVTFRSRRIPEFDQLLEHAEGGFVAYTSDRPKHEFLSYLVHARGYLLHGTGAPLAELRPAPVADHDARSEEQVSAASDGIWPLFFATLDRERAGSLWNGCFHIARRDGALHRYYFFFTESDPRDDRIWRDGTIHILDRGPFARTWIPNEWGSAKAVRPVATLAVSPADFPVRSRVLQLDPQLSLTGNLGRLRSVGRGTV